MFEKNITKIFSIESLTFQNVIWSLSIIGRKEMIKHFRGTILVLVKKNADPRKKTLGLKKKSPLHKLELYWFLYELKSLPGKINNFKSAYIIWNASRAKIMNLKSTYIFEVHICLIIGLKKYSYNLKFDPVKIMEIKSSYIIWS